MALAGSSFIGRIVRRHPSNARWPSEDLLTDISAAVVNHVAGLGRELAGVFAPGRRVEGEVSASTQESPGERRRLDLLLRDEADLEIWIEVKDWAGESGDQLETYERLRRQLPSRQTPVLVYLVRLGATHASLAGVRTVRWQELSERMRAWSDEDSGMDGEQRWLLDATSVTYANAV